MKKFWYIMFFSIFTYFAGILLPILRLEKVFGIFANEQSILSGLVLLFDKREYFIFAIICVFSVIFPIIKFCTMIMIAKINNQNKIVPYSWIQILEEVGRWSMLDVFVVALLVVFVKFGSMANVTPKIGILFFALSIFFTSLSLKILKKNINNSNKIIQGT